MQCKLSASGEGNQPLWQILLAYLQSAPSVAAWPGGDGITADDVLDAYPKAVARGEVPDWQELLRQHPEMEAELYAWLAATDRWKFAFGRGPGLAR